MSGSWAKGGPSALTAGPDQQHQRQQGQTGKTAKMRYVPPPTSASASASASAPPPSSAGKGKMKYVPPPTNPGEWNRPKKAAASGACQWEALAAKEDAQLKASKKLDRASMKQDNSVGMSGNDRADIAATKVEFDLWTKKDVTSTLAWARAEECRIPNKRVAKGGRLHKLINILLNNCEHMSHRLDGEKRYQDACRDPTLASGLDLKRQFVAPLAKRVLNRVEDEEAQQAYAEDDDSDSDGMAM